jgi:hypothetical protein
MTRKLVFAVFSSLVVLGLVGFAAQDEPKYTIKEVMKEAHKGGLLKKVSEGKATEEEKEKLLDLYKALAKNKEPQGPHEDWEKRTKAIVTAAEEVVKGDAAASKKLAAVVNCKECHGIHRPAP